MTSTTKPDNSSAMSAETRAQIQQLARVLLERYQIDQPPVPIDRIVKQPINNLWQAKPSQISFIIGHGIYRFAPRLAEARLLYRLLCDNTEARQMGLEAPWPASRREVKYFARCLLMPEEWIRAMPEADRTPDTIMERFQVTPYDAIIRLAELGLPVPDGARPDLQE